MLFGCRDSLGHSKAHAQAASLVAAFGAPSASSRKPYCFQVGSVVWISSRAVQHPASRRSSKRRDGRSACIHHVLMTRCEAVKGSLAPFCWCRHKQQRPSREHQRARRGTERAVTSQCSLALCGSAIVGVPVLAVSANANVSLTRML